MTTRSGTSFDEWVDEARAVSIAVPVERRGIVLKASGTERVGPCPVCGGKDRFSINLRKGVFHCRGSGAGGDAIALTQYLEGCEFRVACEILTGRPPPDRQAGETAEARAARETAWRARQDARARDEELKARTAARFREQDRARCWRIWEGGKSVLGSPAEGYLSLRGLAIPSHAPLRCLMDHPYFEALPVDGSDRREQTEIYRGPALVAAIIGPTGKFAGIHTTWIDLAKPSGKAEIFSRQDGELLPSKKVRGLAQAGHIPLVRHRAPTILVMGEGTETVLSVWMALTRSSWGLLDQAAFWSAYSLGNIGGIATETVKHPTEVTTDKRGRQRARTVPGPVPDLTKPSIPIPDSVTRVYLLGDGDSDRTTTEMALMRGARRFKQQRDGREVVVTWAPQGEDFNDVLRRAAA